MEPLSASRQEPEKMNGALSRSLITSLQGAISKLKPSFWVCKGKFGNELKEKGWRKLNLWAQGNEEFFFSLSLGKRRQKR